MAGLALHFFGFPQVTRDGAPVELRRRKEIALLAYLAVTQRAHSRDSLAALLWPGYDQTSARGNLRRTLSNLNRKLEPGWLDIDREQVALPPQTGLWIDVVSFQSHMDRCRRTDEPCPNCLAPLHAAIDLYTDDFLTGFSLVDAPEFGVWQVQEAERLRREYAQALHKLAQCLADSGDYAEVLAYARRWLELDPLHEPAHRMLMHLHARSGDRSAAVHQYEECVQVLASELGMQPEPETIALYEQIRSGEATGEAVPQQVGVVAHPPHNLPEQITSFIGRSEELAQIRRRLADPHCRLLTIVGPGGIGKTRLAIQAADQHLDRFPDGICFVDLTAVGSPDLLAPAILHAVAPDEYGDMNAKRRVCEHLRDKQMLLVLDNFEHLLDGADLLPDLLRSAPALNILVTSRRRLNLREEWLEPLDGLAYPAQDEVPANLQDCDSTRLFLDCVRRVRPDWQPSPADAAAITGICCTLEGMPLGIELAAAWTRSLPLADVSAELARGLSILSTSMRDMPARHRSMHAVFDQSWSLLEPMQRSILRQMSVFRGGCTRVAAQAVTGAGLAELTALLESSWLRLRADGRYDMHELVRQYCEEKLEAEHEAATGETPSKAYRRHCDYYARLLAEPATQINFRDDVIRQFVPEFGNIEAGLHRATALPHLPAIHALLVGLWYTSDMLGGPSSSYRTLVASANTLEARREHPQRTQSTQIELLENLAELYMVQAAISVQLSQQVNARVHIQQLENLAETLMTGEKAFYFKSDVARRLCQLYLRQGRYADARQYAKIALSHYENQSFVSIFYGKGARGQIWHQADVLASIAHANWCLGEYGEAERCWRRSIALGSEINERRQRAQHCEQLARLLVAVGSYAQAETLAHEALQVSQSVGDEVWAALGHVTIGRARYAQLDYPSARHHLLQGVNVWKRTRFDLLLSSLAELGRVELAEGNIVAARSCYEEATREFSERAAALSTSTVMMWLGLGWAMLAEDNAAKADEWFRKALATGICAAWEKMEGIAGLAEVAARQGRTEEAVELQALVVAHPFTAHAQRQQSKHALDALRDQVARDVFAQRVDAGAHRCLDVTIAELLG